MEQVMLEKISRHMRNKKVIGSSQHRFTKEKSFLTNQVTFYDELIALVNEEREVDFVYPEFRKAFDTVFPNIFIERMRELGVG